MDVYLPDDDDVEIELIRLFDNVGEITGASLGSSRPRLGPAA